MTTPTKIVRLEAENVKRIRAVEIRPDSDSAVVYVTGNNGQGKSSVLDAIQMALGGKGAAPPRPIREGAVEAHATVELDNGLVVERRWTANDRSTLSVRSADGAAYPSPQAMLDKLIGSLSFDPIAFLAWDAKKQAATVRALAGVDFTALDAKRAEAFEKRTSMNRLLSDLKSQAKALADVEEVEPVNVAELLAELERLQAMDKAAEELGAVALRKMEALARQNAHLLELDEKIEQAERALLDLRKTRSAADLMLENAIRPSAKEATAAAEAAPTSGPDLLAVRERLKNAEAINTRARKYSDRVTLESRVKNGEAAVNMMTAAIEKIDVEKAEQLAAAKLPVPGLGFTEEGVTLGGLPLEQASAAEKLRVSLAMGIALNPTIRVMLIRDGSLLDANSLKLVADHAAAAGVQVWLEVVGKGDVGIVIEDGAVEAIDGKPVVPPEPELPAAKKRRAAKKAVDE